MNSSLINSDEDNESSDFSFDDRNGTISATNGAPIKNTVDNDLIQMEDHQPCHM